MAADSSRTDDLYLAIIGAGRHGRDLINYCLNIPGVRFKAVCDIWPYAQKYAAGILKKRLQPVSVYEDYREMLAREKGLDAVIIATPDSFHAAQTIACLKAKLHVYCEKEMTTTIEDAREVVRAARQARRLLQIGRQHRSNPRYHTALEYLYEKKAIGRIMSVYGQWHGHKRVPYKWPESQAIPAETLRRYGFDSMNEHRNWRWFEKFSAGEIVNLAAHQIDVFNWFLHATPKGVMASGGLDYYDFFELYDNATCFFEWDYTWEGKTKTIRGVHNTLTWTDDGGFYEAFLGNEGAMGVSEDVSKGGFLRAPETPVSPWESKDAEIRIGCTMHSAWFNLPPDWLDHGLEAIRTRCDPNSAFPQLRLYPQLIATPDNKPPHWHHLANFFNALRGTAKLTCPAEVGFQTCVSALKAVEAMKAGRRIELAPQDYIVE
ncbi:MAG: Gfo/Idh/MocA family oxidoreductase [Planctomycetota bacterium]|nr:Gfo/Idh/MocA family oxidoreductase [Planctomycetota bacterium]